MAGRNEGCVNLPNEAKLNVSVSYLQAANSAAKECNAEKKAESVASSVEFLGLLCRRLIDYTPATMVVKTVVSARRLRIGSQRYSAK